MEPITSLLASIGQMFGFSGGAAGAAGAAGSAGAASAAAPAAAATVAAPAAAAPAAAAGSNSLFNLLGKAKDAAVVGGAVEGLKTLLPKTSEEMMAAVKDRSGLGSIDKVYTTITDPKVDFRGKFDVIAPEAWKQVEKNQAEFAQMQQNLRPMQMPSYASPSMPYQGGGIEEILQRQRGLLR